MARRTAPRPDSNNKNQKTTNQPASNQLTNQQTSNQQPATSNQISLYLQKNNPLIKVAFSPIYKYALPEGHRFPMIKYELLAEQLIYEGTITKEQFFHPDSLKESTILATHTREYWDSLKNQTLSPKAARKIGFPMSDHLVKRGRVISRGTIDCGLFALEHGVSLNIAGGTHHAFTDRGEGFCLLNDMAIASTYLLDQQLVERIMIVDLDVHQGNGTAQIFKDNPNVFTFSMHGANNYPLHKEHSDLDIPMPDGTQDVAYLNTLKQTLPELLDSFQPTLVFYLSGVDILATDKLGRLGMTIQGCMERDYTVFKECHKRGLPVAVSMGGGYSERISIIVEAHANTYRAARAVYE